MATRAASVVEAIDPPKPGYELPALRCPHCRKYLFDVTENLRITEGRLIVRCRRCDKQTELSSAGIRLLQ